MPNISSGSETIGESFLLGTLLPIFILKDIFGIKKDKVMPMCLKENICKLKMDGQEFHRYTFPSKTINRKIHTSIWGKHVCFVSTLVRVNGHICSIG